MRMRRRRERERDREIESAVERREEHETHAEYKICNISEPSVPKRIFLLINKTLIIYHFNYDTKHSVRFHLRHVYY